MFEIYRKDNEMNEQDVEKDWILDNVGKSYETDRKICWHLVVEPLVAFGL